MASAGYFTRLAQINEDGPNMPRTPVETAEPVWVCSICKTGHVDEIEARECCKPEVYSRWRCVICRRFHRVREDAEDCHATRETTQPVQCPICLSKAETFLDAAHCCLHTHPTMTAAGRERVAAAVAAGLSWPAAIAENELH